MQTEGSILIGLVGFPILEISLKELEEHRSVLKDLASKLKGDETFREIRTSLNRAFNGGEVADLHQKATTRLSDL